MKSKKCSDTVSERQEIGMIRLVLVALALVAYFIITLPLYLVLLLIGIKRPDIRAKIGQKSVKWGFKAVLAAAGVKVRVRGIENIPKELKDELKIMCVLFTEDIGGTLELVFNEDGELEFRASCDEGDLLYDDIGSGLKMRKLQRENQELLSALELYYQVMTGEFDED